MYRQVHCRRHRRHALCKIQWGAVHFSCIFFLKNVAILLFLRHNRKVISIEKEVFNIAQFTLNLSLCEAFSIQ